MKGGVEETMTTKHAELASPDAWNVYRWITADGDTEWIGSAQEEEEAYRMAQRLGGHQIQHGLDGLTKNVSPSLWDRIERLMISR